MWRRVSTLLHLIACDVTDAITMCLYAIVAGLVEISANVHVNSSQYLILIHAIGLTTDCYLCYLCIGCRLPADTIICTIAYNLRDFCSRHACVYNVHIILLREFAVIKLTEGTYFRLTAVLEGKGGCAVTLLIVHHIVVSCFKAIIYW